MYYLRIKLCAYVGAETEFSSCSDGDLRLVGGNTTNQGRLQICMNNAWGSVCDSQGTFTRSEAKVACRQLGILQVEGLLQLYVCRLLAFIYLVLFFR